VTARIIIPGRLARAGVASRHPVAYAGVKFLEAVHRADGEPLVVAPRELNEEAARRLLGHADGLLLIGGPDVNADLYGSRQGPQVQQVLLETNLTRASTINGSGSGKARSDPTWA
jgi:gamma-glutamyl-gamma-aminobutyrate hydrolase PuuD